MNVTLAFDVYGTLVDPSRMADHLAADAPGQAPVLAELWRQKQLEYAFRRGLMRCYVDFATCTQQALQYACDHLHVTISEARRQQLMTLYQNLPAFDDVHDALTVLGDSYRLNAFSNGSASAVDRVLHNADIRHLFDGVVSVEEVRSFKPDPAVYAHARHASGAGSGPIWLISSNPWDVIGARWAGWEAAWVQRRESVTFDPWQIEPSITIRSLSELPAALADR